MKRLKTFIIAEAGVNHNGKLALAKQLIKAAKSAGADAVKFQTFNAERLVTATASKATYQKKLTLPSETQLAMLKKLELSRSDHKQLLACCRENKILFLSTAFDEQSADLLDALGMKIFKIPSGEITNLEFLKYIAQKGKPMILSTGMSTLKEVELAVKSIFSAGNKRLTLLHCVSDYPAAFDQLNLKAIETLQKTFRLPVGFSDHSLGILMAPVAVALGAVVIEKHLTVDQTLPGPDHQASVKLQEFKMMVENIRLVESALGNGNKVPALCEDDCRKIARRSLTAVCDIAKGEKLLSSDIVLKRPGTGIFPADLKKVVGRQVLKNITKDETLTWAKIK